MEEMRKLHWNPTPINKPVCSHCKLERTEEGHDGCLGTLEGVVNACCNHGGTGEGAYVVFKDGGRLSGIHASDYFAFINRPKPKTAGAAKNGMLELITILQFIEYNWHKEPKPITRTSFHWENFKDFIEGVMKGYAAICAVAVAFLCWFKMIGLIDLKILITLIE